MFGTAEGRSVGGTMQRNACRDASMQMACVAVLFVSLWKDVMGEGILRAVR